MRVGNLVDVEANDPGSGPFVVRAHAGAALSVASTDHERPAGVAEAFQRSEDPVCALSSEISAVLKSEPTRAAFSDDADGFEE